MSYLDNYKARIGVNGFTLQERTINNAKRFASIHAPESPAYKEVSIDGVEQHVLVVSTAVSTEKTIRSMPDEDFQVGSIVEMRGSHWLITERDPDDDITVRGRIELCNRQLTWQSTTTGEIISRWCTASKPYYSNLDENLKVTVSSREYKIQLPYDEETKMIGLDKRFLVEEIAGEPKTYKVTSVDAITNRFDRNGEIMGFLILNITQDQYNPDTDNKELGICDYIDFGNEPEPPAHPDPDDPSVEVPAGTISYNGTPKIYTGGSWKTFTFSVDGIADEEVAPEWQLSFPDEFSGKIEMAADGMKCKVRALDYAELDGLMPALFAKDIISGATGSVTFEVICR